MRRESLSEVCLQVENVHHVFIRENIAEIETLLSSLVQNGDENYPFMVRVLNKFQEVADTLAMNVQKEEMTILPYIRRLEESATNGSTPPQANFPNLRIPVEFILREHGLAMNGLLQIRTYTTNYHLPEPVNQRVRIVYGKLKKFEKGLKEAIDTEERLLFPAAINLEAQIHDNR